LVPADFTIKRIEGLKESSRSKDEPKSFQGRRSRLEKPERNGSFEEEHNLLRTMIDNLPDLIYVKDKKSRFVNANESVARIMGAEGPGDLIGKTDFDFYPKKLAQKYYDDEKKVIRTGKALVNLEEKLITREGDVRWLSTTKVPIRDGRDEVSGIVGIGRDITMWKQAEEKRKESEQLFTYLSEYSPNMIFINVKGRVVYANRICEELMGYKRDEFYSPDFDFMTLIAPESKQIVETGYKNHMAGNDILPYEYTLVTKTGRRIDAIITTKLINYQGDSATLGIITDITKRKKAESELKRSEEQYRTIFENTGTASIIIEGDGKISLANGEFERLTGFTREGVQGKMYWTDFIKEEDRQRLIKLRDLKTGGSLRVPKGYECKFFDRDGNTKQVLMIMEPLPETSKCVASFLDITDRKQAELHLQRMATHDELTKLPNRRLFQQRLEHALARAHRHNSLLGVLYLDLDDFKFVNDTFGHDKGDLLLGALAGRLLECVRENDTVARLGGDEFTMILEDAYQLEDIVIAAERIIESVSKPFPLGKNESRVTISVGIAVYPENGDTAQELLKKSDMAMYKAKRQGKNNYQFYSNQNE
jgi:diguanylate cyclase (GGDEF)-like protein/PAS domain S-box-containing protein